MMKLRKLVSYISFTGRYSQPRQLLAVVILFFYLSYVQQSALICVGFTILITLYKSKQSYLLLNTCMRIKLLVSSNYAPLLLSLDHSVKCSQDGIEQGAARKFKGGKNTEEILQNIEITGRHVVQVKGKIQKNNGVQKTEK